jgi:hypothetical protein
MLVRQEASLQPGTLRQQGEAVLEVGAQPAVKAAERATFEAVEHADADEFAQAHTKLTETLFYKQAHEKPQAPLTTSGLAWR